MSSTTSSQQETPAFKDLQLIAAGVCAVAATVPAVQVWVAANPSACVALQAAGLAALRLLVKKPVRFKKKKAQ
jgi:hypothetical protein